MPVTAGGAASLCSSVRLVNCAEYLDKTHRSMLAHQHRKMPACLTSHKKNRVHNKALNKEQEIIVTFSHKTIKIVTP